MNHRSDCESRLDRVRSALARSGGLRVSPLPPLRVRIALFRRAGLARGVELRVSKRVVDEDYFQVCDDFRNARYNEARTESLFGEIAMKKSAFLVVVIGFVFALFGCQQPTTPQLLSHTITFNANGGTGTMQPQTIVSGVTSALSTNAFTKEGHFFNGWATTPTGSGVYMDAAAYLMGTENVTLHAIWEVGTPGLAFTLINGDTGYSVSCGTVTTGTLIIPAYYNTKRVTAINSFSGCSGLTGSLTIPSGVTAIGNWAFAVCSGFTGSLTIPSTVTSIGYMAFYLCSGFTGNLTIPSSVTSIGDYAFSECSGLTGTLTILNSITSIGDYAFWKCSGLTGSLAIPGTVTSIGDSAFSGCTGLTGSLAIHSGVTSIGNYAFSDCSGLTGSLTIPASITSIGQNAFLGCSGLTTAVVNATTPPTIEPSPYLPFDSHITSIAVPSGSVNAYKTAANWSSYAAIIVSQ